MFSPFERMVAFRYLRARKGERFVSIIAVFSFLGIALGVATLIVVMSVMNGFRQDLLERVLRLNAHVQVQPAAGRALAGWEPMLERVRAVPGVVHAAPVVEGQVLLTTQAGGAGGALARGITRQDLLDRPGFVTALRGGSAAEFEGDNVLIMGLTLASRLGVRIGGDVTLVLPRPRGGDLTAAPQTRGFRVVALLDTGLAEYDANQVLLPLPAAQSYFGLGDGVTMLELFLRNPAEPRQARAAIQQALGSAPVRVRDWQDSNSTLFAAMVVERNVMFLILTLIIIVAAFNIVSSLVMLVKDKGRDIAILRTMGATSGAILRIFLLCGATVGVVGTLLGCGLGLLLALNVETIRGVIFALQGAGVSSPELAFFLRLPAVVQWGEVLQVLVMGLALSLLATVYPSWRAGRLDPVEAIRNE